MANIYTANSSPKNLLIFPTQHIHVFWSVLAVGSHYFPSFHNVSTVIPRLTSDPANEFFG